MSENKMNEKEIVTIGDIRELATLETCELGYASEPKGLWIPAIAKRAVEEIDRLEKENAELRERVKENARLRYALSYYAERCEDDGGRRARKALEQNK